MVAKVADDEAIKTMKLYSNIERLDRELLTRGYSLDSTVPFEVLNQLDSMHYGGNEPLEYAIQKIPITKESSILDVGSGFGGAARFLSHHTGCNVTAIELQPDIHEKAKQLAKRCGPDGKIRYIQGNILVLDPEELVKDAKGFDGIVSWLVFLHIPDKQTLLEKCFTLLAPGASMIVEDFFERQPFTANEEASLQNDVYCSSLPTREAYVKSLEKAGFCDIQFEDKTADWTVIVTERHNQFVKSKEAFVEAHSLATYETLLSFYRAVSDLFNGGNLGGVRIVAKKSV